MRPRISIRGCVRPLVHPSVGPLVRNAFVKIAESGVMQDGDASYVVYMALFRVRFLSQRHHSFLFSYQSSGQAQRRRLRQNLASTLTLNNLTMPKKNETRYLV